jgi:hypothetical protein
MHPSDAVGILASILLIIPAAKDNLYRFIEAQHKRKAERSPWPGLHPFIVEAWKTRRDSYSPWDSFWMFAGGLGLAISFLLKMFEN